MRTWLASIPAFLRFLVYLALAVIVIFILAVIIHAFGGAGFTIHIGHLLLRFAVT